MWTLIRLFPTSDQKLTVEQIKTEPFLLELEMEPRVSRSEVGFGFTFTGRVEQSSLETGKRRVRKRVFDRHLDGEGRVWVHISQGQQVGGAHKEVTVECVDG